MRHSSIRIVVAGALLASCVPAQLSGTYLINPTLPASSVNFVDFASAVSALVSQGINGPVIFEVYDDAGPYTATTLFYSATVPSLASNLNLGDNLAVLVLAAWPGASAANRVTFRPAIGEYPVLDAGGTHACVVYNNDADYVTLEGLELRNAQHDAISYYTASSQSALGNIVNRCVIHHCGRTGILVYGNSGPVNDTLISNNVFHDLMTNPNGSSFSGFIRDGYISGRRENNTQIVHNTFICNTMVQSDGWIIGNYPSSTTYTSFTRVQNNIFVKSATNGFVMRFQSSGGCTGATLPGVADNNCFWDTSGGSFAVIGAAPAGSCTPIANLAAWQLASSKDLSSLSADPLLVTPGTIPSHLSPASPCVSLGGPGSGVTADTDGQLRDSAPDIGADEVVLIGAPLLASVGAGCPGVAGTPSLDALHLPFLGSPFEVRASNAAPNAAVSLFWSIGLQPAPIPVGGSCFMYLDLASFLAFFNAGFNPLLTSTASAAGMASFVIYVPGLPSLAGTRVGLQAAVPDALSPAGFTVTNALDCTVN